MNRLIMTALIAALAVVGCGYSFQGAVGEPPGGITRMAVPTIRNSTTYYDLTTNLTNQLIRQFVLSQALKVVSTETAEAILDVQVLSVEIQGAARVTTGDASASRRVIVRVSAVLKRKSDQNILWDSGVLESRETYEITDTQSTIEVNLTEALEDVSKDLAEKIHNNMFEDF